ncbi:MAG: deoxyribodipyrimidine photo-lyase [Bacilli bacterium]
MSRLLLENRISARNDKPYGPGKIIYWMNRDQRLVDNWALVAAADLAQKTNRPLAVVFVMFDGFSSLVFNQSNPIYVRLGQGLRHVLDEARRLGIDFSIERGNPIEVIPALIKRERAGVLMSDFSPLKEIQAIKDHVNEAIDIRFLEVDAHNVIPVWMASNKAEWGAYTLRPKIQRLLPNYLLSIPEVKFLGTAQIHVDQSLAAWLDGLPPLPTPEAAMRSFIDERLTDYHFRNNPNLDVTSRLSAYLHFGNLSANRLALEVQQSRHPSEEFLEEMIVRRELADNFCHYNQNYDSISGFPDWAKRSLDAHRNDPRPYIYTLEELEYAKTHDPAWNAAQTQLTKTNYMHGYMRMYWAKKILEWIPSPEEAFKTALYLNDKYQLDGRDPNGYVGIAWALGGVHDRPWGERAVFGTVRYMNMAGLKRKFGVDEYVDRWTIK